MSPKLYAPRWRLTKGDETFRACVVTYADDFVILSRGHAAQALASIKGGDDAAWADTQRGQHLVEKCATGALRPSSATRLDLTVIKQPVTGI